MKKIPCLFVREFVDRPSGCGKDFFITPQVTPGLEWVLEGIGIATRKYDGTACMVKDGVLYKRYDVKRGKTPPPDAIACSKPDEVTGHWPHWVQVGDEPESKWHKAALLRELDLLDGTYELCGPHFQGNPERFEQDTFVAHGRETLLLPDRSFDDVRRFLSDNTIEGIVFWLDGEPRCKIRRADFGFSWPVKP